MKKINLDIIGLLIISMILLSGFGFQLFLNEIPCPLCLLQRLAFIGVGIGLMLNINQSNRPAHYTVINISALFGLIVSLRQITLHILPNNPGFGSAILGLHMYTWAAILFLVIILTSSIVLSVVDFNSRNFNVTFLGKAIGLVFITLITLNIISIFLVSGFHMYPDNPNSYLL